MTSQILEGERTETKKHNGTGPERILETVFFLDRNEFGGFLGFFEVFGFSGFWGFLVFFGMFGMFDCWLKEGSLANILSLALLTPHFKITFDNSGTNDRFIVHMKSVIVHL